MQLNNMRAKSIRSQAIIIASLFSLRCGSLFAQEAAAPEAQQQPAAAVEPQPAAAADLPVDISIESIRLFNDLYVGLTAEIEVEIVNNTGADARDVSVGFASDDGSADRQIIALGPDSRERVKLKWVPKRAGKRRIVVSIVSKNDTTPLNNQQVEFVEVSSQTYVDLKIVSAKIPPELCPGSMVNIEAEIANDSDVQIREANVLFNTDDGFKDLKRTAIPPKSSAIVEFSWVPRDPGAQSISLSVECREDMNSGNNELKIPVLVKEAKRAEELKKPEPEPVPEATEKKWLPDKDIYGNRGYFK